MLSVLANGSRATVNSVLPALVVALPLLGAAAVAVIGRRERLRDIFATCWTAGTLALCLLMFPKVMLHGDKLISSEPLFFGNFSIAADQLALLFALAASLLWFVATLYARDYIRHEKRQTRYQAFSLLAESAVLGVFLAGDFFVFFVFFELIALFAYMLVIHNRQAASLAAGSKLMLMSIFGGLSLLFGIMLYLLYAGTLAFTALPGSRYLTGSVCFIVFVFMIAGMGVKAGMVPVHVWLPLAHPAAPSPASALLSGIMIKAGVFGMLRLIGTFGLAGGEAVAVAVKASPEGLTEHASVGLSNLQTIGWAIIILGVITMLTGMVLALVQDNLKRLLAFSSISQIGYILIGLGCGAFLGGEGAIGLAGGIYHAVNHSMFKGLLFLGVGAVIFSVGQADMRKLGGLWRRMPATTVVTCVAGLGIIGIPLFNGFASKTLLHHAIVESLHLGGAWMRAVDILFLVAAAGTTCYILKLIYFTFFKRGEPRLGESGTRTTIGMESAMSVLALGVIIFGVFPHLVLDRLIVPTLGAFGFLEPAVVAHLSELRFFTWANIVAILPALGIGITAFLLGLKWDWFSLRLPRYLTLDYYYGKMSLGFLQGCSSCASAYSVFKARLIPVLAAGISRLGRAADAMRRRYKRSAAGLIAVAKDAPARIKALDVTSRFIASTRDVAFGIVLVAAVVAVVVLLAVL